MRGLALTMVLAVGLAACGASSVESTTTLPLTVPAAVEPAATTTVPVPALDWVACEDAECATLTVPLDHDDPSAGTIDLEVTRLPAARPDQRIGVLLYGPGGPGDPGVPLPVERFSNDLLRRFDVVSWNLRGFSPGTEVVCLGDPIFADDLDSTPETPEEVEALQARIEEFIEACVANSGHLIPHVSTMSNARDMDLIREALGEEQISYLGLSYGTAIGSVYATLYPDRVRAMVLDGVYHISSDHHELGDKLIVRERVLVAALEDCSANRSCYFHHDGEPFAAFDALVRRLDSTPIEVDGRPVDEHWLSEALWNGLETSRSWSALMRSLARAEEGNGRPLAELAGMFDGQAADGGVWATICPHIASDPAGRQATYRATRQEIRHLAPLVVGPEADICDHWPVKVELPPLTAMGTGPILVVGATDDYRSTLTAAREMAERLEQGTLLIDQAITHTSYWPGFFETRCVTNVVDRYLIELELPAHESVCVRGDPVLHPPGR